MTTQTAAAQRTDGGRSSIAPEGQHGDEAEGPLGPRAEERRELRVRLSPRDWHLVAKLRRAYDVSASGLVRAAIRELGVKLEGGSR